jgi:hypothetical protein|tara:strand:- start:1060 stop:1314 length:255 start_codon:yes stop_codon:yes gene_type:complete
MSDKFVNKDGGFNHGKWIRENSLEKPLIKEEFIEIMHDLDDGLALIKDSWLDWRNGPVTEKGDIKPAQKELVTYIVGWLKKNIK